MHCWIPVYDKVVLHDNEETDRLVTYTSPLDTLGDGMLAGYSFTGAIFGE